MTAQAGLRERKKAATRAALSRAAWSLLLRDGLDAVTTDAIAEAAGMSPRTFRNYFSCREEAILGELVQRHLDLVGRIRDRPADEPVWDSLERVLPEGVTEIVGNRDEFAMLARLIRDNPAMLAQNMVVFQRASAFMAGVVADRIGADPTRDPVPSLLAGAVGTAVSTSIELWLDPAHERELPDLIRDCLTQLRSGFPAASAPAG